MAFATQPVTTRTVTSASAEIAATLEPGVQYQIVADTNLWWAIGNNPTAAVGGASSSFLARGAVAWVAKLPGVTTEIAVIRESADGNVTLNKLVPSALS